MNIEIPEGYEIDVENSDFANQLIKLKKVGNGFPRWEELRGIIGYYVKGNGVIESIIEPIDGVLNKEFYQDVFRTESQAQASVAIAKLTQLKSYVNRDWEPDWCDSSAKYCIKYCMDAELTVYVSDYLHIPHLLAFKDKKTAEGFIGAYEDLIKQAAPILCGVEL